MPFDPGLQVAPDSATKQAKPKRLTRSPKETGPASCVLEFRQLACDRLPDRILPFVIKCGALPAHVIKSLEVVQTRNGNGKLKNLPVCVRQWRLSLKRLRQAGYCTQDTNLSLLAYDAGLLGFSVYYDKRKVIPFAEGAGPALAPKHSPSALRRAKFDATHKPADRETALLAQLQLASAWAIGEKLPQDFAQSLPTWLQILASYKDCVREQTKLAYEMDCGEYCATLPDALQASMMEALLHIRQNPPVSSVLGFQERDTIAESYNQAPANHYRTFGPLPKKPIGILARNPKRNTASAKAIPADSGLTWDDADYARWLRLHSGHTQAPMCWRYAN